MTLEEANEYYDIILTCGPSAWDAMMDISMEGEQDGTE